MIGHVRHRAAHVEPFAFESGNLCTQRGFVDVDQRSRGHRGCEHLAVGESQAAPAAGDDRTEPGHVETRGHVHDYLPPFVLIGALVIVRRRRGARRPSGPRPDARSRTRSPPVPAPGRTRGLTRPAAASRRLETRSTASANSPEPQQLDAEHVDLLERQVADPNGAPPQWEADDDDAPGLRGELHRVLHQGGDTRRLEHDLRPLGARPVPRDGREVVVLAYLEDVRLSQCRASGGLEQVDEQHRRAAIGRRERQRLPDQAGAEDHHPLTKGNAPRTTARTAIETGLDQRSERRVLVARRETPGRRHDKPFAGRRPGGRRSG